MLSEAQALALHQLVLAAFDGQGISADTDWHGLVRATVGSAQQFGLHNLAVQVAAAPWRAWSGLVEEHVSILRAGVSEADDDAIGVRDDMLLLKLRARADLPFPTETGDETFLPGLVVLPAIDYPNRVAEMFKVESLEPYGGLTSFRETAFTNLRALPVPDHQELSVDDGGAVVHVFVTDDFFGAARALVLDHLLATHLGIERPAHGVLVAVPNRHVLAVHVVEGVGVVRGLQTLANLARGQHEEAPGPISQHVYFLPPDGAAEQVTRDDGDGNVAIVVDGRFRDALLDLGLLGD